MSKPTKSKQKSGAGASVAQQPSSVVIGFAVLSIAFLLATDGYYVWRLLQL